jgi:hypothetical protein
MKKVKERSEGRKELKAGRQAGRKEHIEKRR